VYASMAKNGNADVGDADAFALPRVFEK